MDQPNQPLRPLLTTKLHIPQACRDLVPRPRLFARLHQGLSSKLTLVSAPAGFGKTTLVSAWMATRNAQQELSPATWAALDAGDNDPVRFWRYVITACQTFDVAIGQSALALLHMQRAEQHWRAEENAPKPGEVLTLRSLVTWWQGDQSQAFTVAKQALALLPAGGTQWRRISLDVVGMARPRRTRLGME